MNRNPVRRGFSRNGAPAGYGQQRGASPFLDSPDPSQGQDEGGARAPMAYERNAPSAPQQEPDFFGPLPNEDPTQAAPGQQQPAFQQALQMRSKQGYPQLASAQGFQPQQSTGSGAFGAGARLPQQQPYGQAQVPQGYGQQPQQADPYGQQQAAPQPTGLAAAVQAARANNYSDIEGAQGIAAGNFQNQLEGFGNIDPNGERGSNTHKKLFGRIASRYDVSQPDAVKRMMADPDFQAAFPDAKLVEHPNADLIDFGDGNPVDVIRGAVAGGSGAGWQWGVGGGQGAPQQGGAGFPGAGGVPGQVPQGDMAAQLLAALQGGQAPDQTSIEQILASLGIGQQQQFQF